MRKIWIIVFLSVIAAPLSAGDVTVDEILDGFGKHLEIPTVQGLFTVKLISSNGEVREIEARAYQKLVGKAQNNRLFIFDFPPTVRGTALLLHSFFDGRDNNMWIYLPAVRRVKRIALESSGGGYFMGSDFTYRDLINNDNSKLDFKLLPDENIYGYDSYVIKAWGETSKIQQEHGYSYIISYYRKEDFMMHARHFYDFEGELLKIYKNEDLIDLSGLIYPTRITMTNVQTNHKSILQISEVSTEEIPDRFFTQRYMQNN